MASAGREIARQVVLKGTGLGHHIVGMKIQLCRVPDKVSDRVEGHTIIWVFRFRVLALGAFSANIRYCGLITSAYLLGTVVLVMQTSAHPCQAAIHAVSHQTKCRN